MNNEVMVFLDRMELEFIKNEVVEITTHLGNEEGKSIDRDWIIKLAAKLIETCETSDRTENAMNQSEKLVEKL